MKTPALPAFFLALAFAAPLPAEQPLIAPGGVTTFAPVVEKVGPSVVTIFSTKKVRRDPRFDQFLRDPMWRRFFGDPDRFPGGGEQQGLGSGVVISPDGFIATNNHVIEGADEIKVSFGTESKEYIAKKVGTDPRSDIALLKIEAAGLPVVEFADSDQVRVGDIVLALGSPLGLRQSVTMGIVSALDRGELGIVDYENFIQTDAAINEGNSGGPLVDVHGRLVGINTAIVSRSGGNQGIGFAVPSNVVSDIVEKLRSGGRVSRGFLGVLLQPVDAGLAKAFKLENENGALVAEVPPGTPAAKAGLKSGDVIVALNGKPIGGVRQLRLSISALDPGSEASLTVFRDGKRLNVSVKLAELPGEDEVASGRPAPSEDDVQNALDGVTVGDLDGQVRRQLRIPPAVNGALVTRVEPDSAAAKAGLKEGDVILDIDRQPVADADQAIALSRKIAAGQQVLLRVYSGGTTRFLVVDDLPRD